MRRSGGRAKSIEVQPASFMSAGELTGDDRHRMDLLGNEALRLPDELARKHDHTGRAVTHLIILDLGDI